MTYVHSLSPFALRFTETFGIRWYGLAYLAGFIFGYYAILAMTKKGRTQFKPDQVADFITYVAIGVLAGGRLGYALFYSPDLFVSFDGHFPYWGVLKVNEGGMASHGGILGVMVVCFLYARYHKMLFTHCLDLTVYGGALGFFFGRIANFINGELFGREADPQLAWAVKFPSEMILWAQKQPEKLNELKAAVEVLSPAQGAEWAKWVQGFSMESGARSRVYDMIEQLITAVQNGNQQVIEALAPVLTARHPSQLYQAVLEGLLVFLILVWFWRKPRKPGVVGGLFGALYCTARIVGEQFRMPDAHIGFQWLGLTRGQWLSVAMLAVAILYTVAMSRRSTKPLGGWS